MRVSHQRLVFFCVERHIWTLWTHQEGRTDAVDTHTDEGPPPTTPTPTPTTTTDCVYTRKHFCVPHPGKCLPVFESVCYKLSVLPLAARPQLVLGLPSRCVNSFHRFHELRPAGGNPSSESITLSPTENLLSEKTCELKSRMRCIYRYVCAR